MKAKISPLSPTRATAPASPVLVWDTATDTANIRPTALHLRKAMAQKQIAFLRRSGGQRPSPIVYWRRQAMRTFALMHEQEISGRILEIGAGAGWCSADLSKLHSVNKVFCLDYEPTCVNELMPLVHSQLSADNSKILRVLGSFNSIRTPDSYFDYIYSMGAIHHSEDLGCTMRELFRVLKPGGYILALERCEYNTLTNKKQRALERQPVPEAKLRALYGDTLAPGTIAEIDNSNHFFRLLDYEHASLTAGFVVSPFTFDTTGRFIPDFFHWLRDSLIGRYFLRLGRTYRGFSKHVLYPFFALDALSFSNSVTFDKLMLVLQKPLSTPT